ncbi:unnamed protein product [Arabis nemorensis]|uniref:Uncharacterized protein n=1 Tax=Arabis nemorensis TaxID=586526 RepID=A0A565CDR4_9BRAS|nr:unnamed protein product [Arabis nemorensis]
MRNANKIQDRALKPTGKGYIRFEFFDNGLSEDDEAIRKTSTSSDHTSSLSAELKKRGMAVEDPEAPHSLRLRIKIE